MTLIDKKELLNRLNNPQGKPLYWDKKTKSADLLDWYDAVRMVEEAPAIEERKKGKWIGKPIAGYDKVRCSVCNDVFLENDGRWNFCPNCGADMREENKYE